MKLVMTTVSILTEAVVDLKGMIKSAEKKGIEVDDSRIKREKKAKREKNSRDKREKQE